MNRGVAVLGDRIFFITDNSNNVIQQAFAGNLAANGLGASVNMKLAVTGLVCGTAYTYKVRASTAGSPSATLLAATTFPAWFRARPLVP